MSGRVLHATGVCDASFNAFAHKAAPLLPVWFAVSGFLFSPRNYHELGIGPGYHQVW
ncbi:MAG: hypothetical protein OXQ89_22005 [Rhodospirillaceae bacterium]|nr:hypothetical protein [Rhodospirillaceae bacterium]